MSKIVLNLCLIAMCISSASADVSTPLRDLAKKHRLPLGSAAPIDLLRSEGDGGKFPAFLSQEFNLLEPENDFKPPTIWRGDKDFHLDDADWLLGKPGEKGWAQNHSMRVRGHVLVYARDDGYTVPRWLMQKEAQINADQARDLLHDYITMLVGRYRGKVAMWDVANEAIDDRPNQNPFNLRNSFWFRKLGPEFLVLAFKYAREADPRVELYYNEYGIEGGGPKADHVIELLKWLKQQRAPITGLGMQWHIDSGLSLAPGDAHYQFADRVKEIKLGFMITELDVAVPVVSRKRTDPDYGMTPRDPNDLQAQANVYKEVFEYALSYSNCRGINLWGFNDRHSWIPGFSRGERGAATISDQSYERKPAYWAIWHALSR